jgi:SAM-dependent methyltransferase
VRPFLTKVAPEIKLDARNEFYLRMLAEESVLAAGKSLVDLGAGLSVFGPMCRAYGMEVTLVDDFGGGGGVEYEDPGSAQPVLDAFERESGLKIIRENFLERPLPLPDASIDAVTSFHSLEHWHNSPRRLFREIVRILKPGGIVVIATPNAVNIRKRVYVLLGKNNFPVLKDWYEMGDPVWRGHVREPVIRDLHQLAEWNGLKVIRTYGRNFIGRRSRVLRFLPVGIVNAVAVWSDRLIRLFPSLCSDIHVVARKPKQG